jgi:hypothetical protein
MNETLNINTLEDIMKEIRLATDKKTGRSHIVNRIDFDRNLVFVFGPVTGYDSNGKTEHLPGGSISIENVDIKKIRKDGDLAETLCHQAINLLKERGFIKVRRNNRGTKVITPLKPYENVGI